MLFFSVLSISKNRLKYWWKKLVKTGLIVWFQSLIIYCDSSSFQTSKLHFEKPYQVLNIPGKFKFFDVVSLNLCSFDSYWCLCCSARKVWRRKIHFYWLEIHYILDTKLKKFFHEKNCQRHWCAFAIYQMGPKSF